MKKLVLLSLLLTAVMFYYIASAEGMSGCDTNCAACHTLTEEEATDILKQLGPAITVKKIQVAPSKGLWEITIKAEDKEGHQKDGVVYLDYSKGNVILGNILKLKTKENLTDKRMGELKKFDYKSIPTKNAIVLGSKKAKYKIIVFTDPDCPFCQKLHGDLKQVVAERDDIAFYIMLFPLTEIHPDSYKKAVSIMCTKSMKLLDDAAEKKEIPEENCSTKAVDDNIKLGNKLGITGTPTVILPDGRQYRGNMKTEELLKAIENK
ncbi:DsbC family protein [Candidatus Magnetomonas plexicatena]|uniref:DsbC family protein n=1 Tax=Candidatus Magnetomonas plexicatena TaxID=2552947 RepID=UPI001102D007|nr:DsbC family protein [Nitrospirales bacterium LBB_01]